jgi:hypothetical protein
LVCAFGLAPDHGGPLEQQLAGHVAVHLLFELGLLQHLREVAVGQPREDRPVSQLQHDLRMRRTESKILEMILQGAW